MNVAEKIKVQLKRFGPPTRDSYKLEFKDYFRLRRSDPPPADKGERLVEAVNENTLKLMQMIDEARFQAAAADWKSSVAMCISVLAMLISCFFGFISHRDSNSTSEEIRQSAVRIIDAIERTAARGSYPSRSTSW